MNTELIFTLIGKLVTKIQADMSDREITVDELIDLIKEIVDDLGYGKKVILNFQKSETK